MKTHRASPLTLIKRGKIEARRELTLLDVLKRMAAERGPVLMPDMLVAGHPLLNEPATRFHLLSVLSFDLLRRFIRRKRRR